MSNTGEAETAALRAAVSDAVLSSVMFVMDYLQLCFYHSCLTAYINPVIFDSKGRYTWNDEAYGNRLRSLIGHKATFAEVIPGKELRMQFDNGIEFWIPLEDDFYTGPEAVMLQSEDNWFVI